MSVLSFDGVYASAEQRVAGGGCLDLVTMVTQELGLEEGSLTGSWDLAHNQQIIWKNGVMDHPLVLQLIDLMFSAMDDYRTGQAGSIFREKAAELANLVLSNKKNQTTRFVTALARGLQTFLRNLPTLINILGQDYNSLVLERNNAAAREKLAKLSKLRDSRNLLLAIGLAQVLELYCRASLQSQHSYRFPTQAWAAIVGVKEELEALRNRWKWKEVPLVYTDIQAPATIVKILMETGVYRPELRLGVVRRREGELRDMGTLKEGQHALDLFDNDGLNTVALAGEVSLEVPLMWRARRSRSGLYCPENEDGRSGGTRHLTVEDVKEVEKTLEDLSGSILDEWDKRQVQTSLEFAAFTSLHQPYDWGEDLADVLEEGSEATVHIRHSSLLKELLSNLVKELPHGIGERFDPQEMLEGYSSFLKTSEKLRRWDTEMTPDIIYQAWYQVKARVKLFSQIDYFQRYSLKSDSHARFALLFQNVQIRTSSEVN